MPRPDLRHVALILGVILAGCARRDGPPPTPEARKAHRLALAAAAQDRLVLQYLVKDAEAVEARMPSMRRATAGYVSGDTSVIWFGFFAGDTLVVLDETRRGPAGTEENARYLFRDSSLRYVALDRVMTAGTPTPIRTRLAFGYDSTGALSATSKNVNDAAVPLDTANDVTRIATRATALRRRVLAAAPR
ncbi:MAG TPA: hypothetical protein VE861_01865 [Gemmatimonadaceae bacterium]|nr:hypothetical protein [Gemmatimonadaceae bacterium]